MFSGSQISNSCRSICHSGSRSGLRKDRPANKHTDRPTVFFGYYISVVFNFVALLLHTIFFSVGYTAQDVVYRWNNARQVAIAEDMKLSQFDLIATPAANHTDTIIITGYKDTQNTYVSK